MSLTITPNKQQALSLKNQLLLLSLPANKRVRILKTLGRSQRTKARLRIRQQQDLDGKKFAERANGKNTKMLKRMAKGLEPYVKNANRLELKHKSTLAGRIAALQQAGGSEKMTAKRMKRIHGKPDYDAPASRSQAKALISLGAKTRKQKGKGYRRATIKELVASLTNGQAELALESLRAKKPKQNWKIPVKPRAFLGDTPANVQAELATLLNQLKG